MAYVKVGDKAKAMRQHEALKPIDSGRASHLLAAINKMGQ
jgi:hypothetical protein